MQEAQDRYNDLEDAVLVIEDEKANWVKGMENANRLLADESARRQHFEQEIYNNQVEIANHRNTTLQAERELVKAAGDIKARDAEITLYKSRENKTIVEHVHVLESAKKVTDRQLAEQIRENERLNKKLKGLETLRKQLVGDLEDIKRQYEMVKAISGRDARSARASLSAENKDTVMELEDERKGRRVAEARIASLEKDLQDHRRQLSTSSLSSPSRDRSSSATEGRLAKMQFELNRLEQAHNSTLIQNSRLKSELAEATRLSTPRSPSRASDSSRADLLRGFQQSHDALERDMSDQLRKLEAQPLTPSQRHNSSVSNGHGSTPPPDLHAAKRIRLLEVEIVGLRRQLENEKEEKEFLQEQVMDVQGGRKGDGPSPFPYEQAVYSHFRLKAKSLRSQLDQ